MLRDRNTSREDFIFFTDRLSTILSERAVEFLPHAPKNVITPVLASYAGKKLAVEVRVSHHESESSAHIYVECMRCLNPSVVSLRRAHNLDSS